MLNKICKEYYDLAGNLYDVETEKNLSPYSYHDEVTIAATKIKYFFQCQYCLEWASPTRWRTSPSGCPICGK